MSVEAASLLPVGSAPTAMSLAGLAAALGLGLLIGLVRERGGAPILPAGLRTHALTALAGALAWWMGMAVFVAALLLVGLFAAMGYRSTREVDPGLTGEITLVLTLLLGGLAMHSPALAAGLGVVAAALLHAKGALHRLVREVLSERELHDGLLLLAAALVVLPLLPEQPVDPWGALRPNALWRLVVLIMAVGMLGHLALRLVGARWGLPVAGFFAGFVSSTAAVAGFGQRMRQTPALRTWLVAAALFSNLASLLLFIGLVGAVSPTLLSQVWPPLAAAAAVLLAGGVIGLWRAPQDPENLPPEPQARAFRLGHALVLAAIIAGVLLLSAVVQSWFGSRGVLVASALVALAEWHAAAASLAQLYAAGTLPADQARLGLVLLLLASTAAKSVLAFGAGGRSYGLRVMIGLLGMCGAAVAVMLLRSPSG